MERITEPVYLSVAEKALGSRAHARYLLDHSHASFKIKTNADLKTFIEARCDENRPETEKYPWCEKGIQVVKDYLLGLTTDQMTEQVNFGAIIRKGIKKNLVDWHKNKTDAELCQVNFRDSWPGKLIREILYNGLSLPTNQDLLDSFSGEANLFQQRLYRYLVSEKFMQAEEIRPEVVHLPREKASKLTRAVELAEVEHGKKPKVETIYSLGIDRECQNLVYARQRSLDTGLPVRRKEMPLVEILKYTRIRKI